MTGFGNEIPGKMCGASTAGLFCGHTNMVHTVSSTHNQVANDECQLCRLEFLNGKLEALVELYTARIAESPDRS